VRARRLLRAAGWQVLTVWECQLRRPPSEPNAT
jgi:G:T-mismatch repair DNA endonuclease (very short patch repair protein)